MCIESDGLSFALLTIMECPYCIKSRPVLPLSEIQIPQSCKKHFTKLGHYFRSFDKKLIQRFKCQICKKSYSSETTHPCKYQKKRFLNQSVYELLVSGISQRRCAKILRVNQKTVVRKFLFLGHFSLLQLEHNKSQRLQKIEALVFDDMESFEHSKCKPLSITLAVEDKTRLILGFKVSSMPAKGLLAAIARKKYGYRPDHRAKNRKELFKELQKITTSNVLIKSDESPHYVEDVRKYFNHSYHERFKGRRGCIVGQGELKAGGYDPLFSLNHTAAMLRANINRLFRRTWNTTKKPERLNLHIAMYALYHNQLLI